MIGNTFVKGRVHEPQCLRTNVFVNDQLGRRTVCKYVRLWERSRTESSVGASEFRLECWVSCASRSPHFNWIPTVGHRRTAQKSTTVNRDTPCLEEIQASSRQLRLRVNASEVLPPPSVPTLVGQPHHGLCPLVGHLAALGESLGEQQAALPQLGV